MPRTASVGRQQRQAAAMMWWGPVQEGLTADDVDHLTLATRLRVPESGRYSSAPPALGEFRLMIDGDSWCSTRRSVLALGADVVEAS